MRFSHTPAYALAIVTLVTLHSTSASDSDRQYQFARGLYARSQWEAAADEFEDFLDNHPDHPDAAQAEFYLGEALVQQHRYEDAANRFDGYLKSLPDGPHAKQARFRVAECAFLGSLPSAEQLLTAFSEAFPDDRLNGLVLNYRGQLALRHEQPRQAEGLFRQSLDRFAGDIAQDECRLGLARALEAQGNSEEARRYYQALAAKPHSRASIEAKYRLGAMQYSLGQYEAALNTFAELESLPQSDPWFALAAMGKGWTLMKLDRHRDAANIFDRITDHPVVAVQARYWLGLCRKAQKNWNGATQALLAGSKKLEEEQAGHLATSSAGDVTKTAILFHAGDCQLAAGDLAKARSHFDQAIAAAEPDDTWLDDARRAAVQTSLHLGDHSRAQADAEKFLASCSDPRTQADLLRLLARTQLELADFSGAEQTLRRLEPGIPNTDASIETDYLLALSYQGQQRYDEARKALEPVLAGAKEKLAQDARLVEGSLLVALRQYDAALKVLSDQLDDLPEGTNRDQALALTAVCHAHLGHADQAEQVYQQVSRNNQDSATLRWDAAEQIAESAFDAGHLDRAEALYRELIENDTDKIRKNRATVGLAWVQHKSGDDTSAEATLAGLTESDVESDVRAEAFFLRGCVLRELGQTEAACKSFEQVAQKHAESDYANDAIWEAARLHEQLGHLAQAARFYQQILDIGPAHTQHADALYNLAWIRQGQADTDGASELFRRILAEHPDSPYRSHALLSVAQHLFDKGNRTQASAMLDQFLKNDPDPTVQDRALYLAGQIAFASGVWQQARQRFEQLVHECPKSDLAGKAAFAAAEAAFDAKDADAVGSFESLLGQSEALSEEYRATAQMRLAQLYAESNRWDEAAAIAEPFSAEHPAFPQQYEVDYVRGRCLATRALFDEARQVYEEVIQSPAGKNTETAAKAQLMIAETYFHQRHYAEAFRAYMQVEILYDFPELRAAALLQAGKCRQLQGDAEGAAKLYEQLIKDYPGTKAAQQAAHHPARKT